MLFPCHRLFCFLLINILLVATVALGHAQQPSGGGAIVRDIFGAGAVILRRPENPSVNSGAAAGGRLTARSPRPTANDKEKIIARGNAARNASTPRYLEAEEQYQLAAKLDPNDPRALAGLGNIYLDQERFAEAVTAYRQAIRVKPDYLKVYMPLGYALVRTDNFKESLDVYSELARRTPDDPEVHNNLGFVYNHSKQYDEAVLACELAIKLLGKSGEAYKEGLQDRDEVLTQAYKNLGNAFNGLKRYPQAVTALSQAILFEPENAAAHFNLGLAHYNAGQYSDAVLSYQRVLQLKPKLPAAQFNLGITHVAMGDKPAALADYEALKAIDTKLAEKLYHLIKK